MATVIMQENSNQADGGQTRSDLQLKLAEGREKPRWPISGKRRPLEQHCDIATVWADLDFAALEISEMKAIHASKSALYRSNETERHDNEIVL